MVTQGHVALALGQAADLCSYRLTLPPAAATKAEHCYTNLSDALEATQSMSDLTGEIESIFQDAMR
jgi:hypothetical protein